MPRSRASNQDMNLSDPKWSTLVGGYRVPYDPRPALMKLTANVEDKSAWDELWNELHHQGDVGLASYLAVPHLLRIAKEKQLFDFNVFGLVAAIEVERHNNNPVLPKEYEAEYLQALRERLPELVKIGLTKDWDVSLAATVLSAVAASKGHIPMADAIMKMEDEDLTNLFLENY